MLLLLAATIAPPVDPHFTARWDSATSATVQWTQAQRGCLYRLSASSEWAFIGCYERPATYTIELGHAGPIDASARPTSGDVFVLITGGAQYRAPLIGRPQYLPIVF
jgi:hypothetical protein